LVVLVRWNHIKRPTFFPIPRHTIRVTHARSSGPGGQNVNKLNTKVFLFFDVLKADWMPLEVRNRFMEQNKNRINNENEFYLYSERHRTQELNTEDAFEKLQHLVDEASYMPPERISTKVPEWSKKKRKHEKQRRSEVKQHRGGFDD